MTEATRSARQLTGTKSGRKRVATAVVLGVAGLSVTNQAHATQPIFDSLSTAIADGDLGYFAPNRFSNTTGFSGTQDPLTTTQEGIAITIPAGVTSINGFDLDIGNATQAYNSAGAGVGTTFNGLQVNAYFWGTLNPGTINSSSPAFSNLLGSQTYNISGTGFEIDPGYAYEFAGGNPDFLLSTPIALTGQTSVGVTFEIQGSTDGGTTFAPIAGLQPTFTQGSPFNAGSTVTNATYINVAGEQNGNFNEAPLVVYNKGTGAIYQYQAVATTIYGPPTNYYWASANSPDGQFSTATNWTPNGVPGSIDTANFNLASSGYVVSLPNAFTQFKGLSVQTDNVTLDLPGAYPAQIYISNTLTVGQPGAGSNTAHGVLAITNSLNNETNLFEAGSVAVGGNGGTGVMTIGQGIYFYTDNDTAINAGSSFVVQPYAKFETNTLTIAGSTDHWTGTLDIGQSALKIAGGNIATVINQIKSGFNGGTWTGTGITSSAAAADTTHLTAVGAILNNDGHGNEIYGSGTALGVFDAANELQNPDGTLIDNSITDVLLRYTYYGDANLDGQVDGSDYTLIDNGFNNHLTGWYNGDFNYDGVVDGSDYTLIDNAFNNQGGLLLSNDVLHPIGAGEHLKDGEYSYTRIPLDGPSATSTAQISAASVPEPTSLGLLGLGMIPLLRRRRALAKNLGSIVS